MATSRLTGDAVKANTGQYDCADVHSLAMPRAGLRVIEALAPCVRSSASGTRSQEVPVPRTPTLFSQVRQSSAS